MPRKKREYKYRPHRLKTVTVVIDKGMVGNVIAPPGVNVVIHDYDVKDYNFTDSELKTDAKTNRKYAEEVWEGADA
jgi:hypothetical protein